MRGKCHCYEVDVLQKAMVTNTNPNPNQSGFSMYIRASQRASSMTISYIFSVDDGNQSIQVVL
jgi:hypothetical protein